MAKISRNFITRWWRSDQDIAVECAANYRELARFVKNPSEPEHLKDLREAPVVKGFDSGAAIDFIDQYFNERRQGFDIPKNKMLDGYVMQAHWLQQDLSYLRRKHPDLYNKVEKSLNIDGAALENLADKFKLFANIYQAEVLWKTAAPWRELVGSSREFIGDHLAKMRVLVGTLETQSLKFWEKTGIKAWPKDELWFFSKLERLSREDMGTRMNTERVTLRTKIEELQKRQPRPGVGAIHTARTEPRPHPTG